MVKEYKRIIAKVKFGDVLREGPSVAQPVIYKFPKETEVEIVGMSENRGWFFVRVNDMEGWVFKRGVEF